MQVKPDQNHLEAAALSLCVAAAMLAGCNVTDAPGLSAATYETYGAEMSNALQRESSRLQWPRMLLDSR